MPPNPCSGVKSCEQLPPPFLLRLNTEMGYPFPSHFPSCLPKLQIQIAATEAVKKRNISYGCIPVQRNKWCVPACMCTHIHTKIMILIILIKDEERASGHDCEPGTTHSFPHHCFIPFDLNLNPSELDGCICQGGCALTCWDQKPDAGNLCAIHPCLEPGFT